MKQTKTLTKRALTVRKSAGLESFSDLASYIETAPRMRRFEVQSANDFRIDLRSGTDSVILMAAGRVHGSELNALLEQVSSGMATLALVGHEDDFGGIEAMGHLGVTIPIALPVSPERLLTQLRNAVEVAALRRTSEERARWAGRYRYELGELIEISRAIGSERDVKKLLDLILAKSRQITGADAGSLYIMEGEGELSQKKLRFMLTQNDSIQVNLVEFTLPVDSRSIVGASVLSGQPISIRDLYRLDQESNPWGFRHDKSVDEKTGYQTRSMLTVPMLNHNEEVIGVVQLINRKANPAVQLKTKEDFDVLVVPFDLRSEELARSLTSQAGISLENAMLYEEMRRAFEGFVKASVTAIESRDPTTSGHSQRVATLTVGLAKRVDDIDEGEFASLKFSREGLLKIEYAALLHDFGKVGVREHVLLKGKKLYEHQREVLQWRFDYIRKAIQAEESGRKLQTLVERSRDEALEIFGTLDRETSERLRELDEFLSFILKANEPTILAEGGFERLAEIASRRFVDPQGQDRSYIEDFELKALSIPRGSLTDDERMEIESHVVHTYNFLKKIPWGRKFKNIPEIAAAHHEKLDGTGYPNRIGAGQIPVESRMMTISDIFDALNASDRPYKKAVPTEKALAIIESEVKAGKVDAALFGVFVQAGIYKLTSTV